MTSLPKKRTRKPRAVKPIETPKTPMDMDKVLGLDKNPDFITRNNTNNMLTIEQNETIVSGALNSFFETATVSGEKALNYSVEGKSTPAPDVRFDLQFKLPGDMQNMFEIQQHVIWSNLMRYLLSKGRNMGGELHLNRPFIRRVQRLLGISWDEYSDEDKKFVLRMLKEMPK
jgi:hypothetical protein